MKKCLIYALSVLAFQISFAQDMVAQPSLKIETNSVKKTITFSAAELPSFKSGQDLKNNFQIDFNRLEGTINNTVSSSPYTTSLLKDGLAIGAAVGVTLLGYSLIANKDDLTMAELATKTKDKLPFFDRSSAGFYSPQADKDSYILFDASYAIPFIAALIDKKQRSNYGQIAVLYIETIGITGAMYTLTAGLVYRSRPFVYGTKAPLDKRLGKGGQRSFYGGHVATTAASTFFVAKVFHDFNPGSKLTPYLYVASGGLTALMGYFRYRAGYHFLSDCVLSSVVGAATGILIPQLHKNKALSKLSIAPEVGNGSSGLAFTYRF
ncbi:MAG: phosphatase PAP2 family protein [Ginsengibacter sp.]